MKRILFGMSAAALMSIAATAQTKPAATHHVAKKTTATAASGFKTTNDTLSYAIGLTIGENFKHQDLDSINIALVRKGMEDALKGNKAVVDPQRTEAVLQNFSMTQRKKQQEERQKKEEEDQAIAKEEAAKGVAFLAANGKRAGVITLPDGLEYEILRKGDSTGAMPRLQDTVTANYAGTLIDGTEFDNSYKRGQPITLPVGGVIRGWTEILQLMHVGEKLKVYIPSELGYGDRGAGASIPGGSALIFEMELLSIKPGPTK